MAWGYWNAHSLNPSRGRPRSLSPAPPVRSRDHSLDRPSLVKLCATPEPGRCGTGECGVGRSGAPGQWTGDRATLPRMRECEGGGGAGGEQRHTLPRGRTEPDSSWGEQSGGGGGQLQGKTSSEGDCCPGCNSTGLSNISSRVSFHSVKDSSSAGQTGTSSEPGDREPPSSSLPTPPPPPAQVTRKLIIWHLTEIV